MDSVSTILTTLDAAITAAGQRFFEATASAVGPIYSSLLALLLVMVGINAALNVYRIAMRDAVQLAFRIVMVLMFGLTWSNFSQIYQAASNGLSDLALEYFRLGGSGVATSATAAMDDMANMMAGNVDSVSSAKRLPDFAPVSISDDGRKTTFVIPPGAPMPTIFRADAKGQEYSVNSAVRGTTITVSTRSERWVLRYGDEYVCVTAEAGTGQ